MSEEAIDDENTLPANIALAVQCTSRREALDQGLVILAMNLPYWHVHQAGGHELYVETEFLPKVEDELRAFREEQAVWRPRESDHGLEDRPASFYVPYVATLLLVTSFILQNAYAPNYVGFGRMDSVRFISQGEWWRPLTSLFLHGDPPHLLGNLIFGLWYGTLVNRGYGTWLGWGLILLSGVLGNAIVGMMHYPESHLSIGASTAVFGALGLLVAEGLIYRWHQRFTARLGQVLLPFVAGGILLGFTGGFDDPQTDGAAHVMGFLSGFLLGIFAALRFVRRESSLRQ